MTTSPADHPFEALAEGTRAEHRYVITSACHQALTVAFGDVNPLHVDADFARRAGFDDTVMHGAVLQGFLSHFIGMVLPGLRSLLLSIDMRYVAPSHLGDEILLRAEITQRVESQRVVVLSVVFQNLTR